MAKNLMSLLRQSPKLRFFHRPPPILTAAKPTQQARSLIYLKNAKIQTTHLRIGALGGSKVEETGRSVGGFRRFTTRATHVNDAGSIDSPLIQSMEKKIKEELNAESVIVRDAYGDGRHVSIDVISSAFEGQSAVNRQRMVYKAIWEELQNIVHAVDQMTTKTPSEASAQK